MFLQQSGLLLLSLGLDLILNGVKAYKILTHINTARKYKRWRLVRGLLKKVKSERLAKPHADMTAAAKTVREKLLKKHFFFTEWPGGLVGIS